jgi:RND family efflux transporter MFP subunit
MLIRMNHGVTHGEHIDTPDALRDEHGRVVTTKSQGDSMFIKSKHAVVASVVLTATSALSGCGGNQAAERAMPPPAIQVAQVISRPVTDSQTFTGHFDAIHHVDVRPRVSGYISAVDFVDGSTVHKGQLLFVIDPRPYRAQYLRAKAQLDQAKAAAVLAREEAQRAVTLYAARAISQDEFDQRTAAARQAGANVEAAAAALDTAALNLRFTQVRAPISGRASRAIVTVGNLVRTGQTLLTTIVSLNPIYVTFNADEQAYLKFEKYARRDESSGTGGQRREALGNPVFVGLEDEHGYLHQGRLVFMNNALNAATGTIRARALLANPGDRFVPGLFARVKLIGNEHYQAVLIRDSAVGTNQTAQFVLVVGPHDRLHYRSVRLGPVVDGLRVVREGLKPGDLIVVNGLMRVQPGMRITPQRVAMNIAQVRPHAMVARNATLHAQRDQLGHGGEGR